VNKIKPYEHTILNIFEILTDVKFLYTIKFAFKKNIFIKFIDILDSIFALSYLNKKIFG
jgi:hypothetical protein